MFILCIINLKHFFFMGSSFCVLHNNQVFGASDYETIIRPYCEK